jgi:hypothetical protein
MVKEKIQKLKGVSEIRRALSVPLLMSSSATSYTFRLVKTPAGERWLLTRD